jgi:ElaB/YqjD/DUF883 family membrane-anchored ribosome-binding protein
MASNQKQRTRTHTIQRAKRKLRGDEHEHDLGEQVGVIAEDLRELGSIAADGVSSAVHRLQHRGSGVLEEGQDQLTHWRSEFEDYVARNPVKSVLFAAALGGLLVFSRRN